MATRIQFRRGTTSQHSTFTGSQGEITVDTDRNAVVVHDGSTAGGIPMALASMGNVYNPQFQGTASMRLPNGTGAQRGSSVNGAIRYNTDIGMVEAYQSSGWYGIGSLGRIYNANKTDIQSMTSYNFTDVVGLSVTLTPASSNSKFLVLADLKASSTSSSNWGGGHMAILRNGSQIHYAYSSGSDLNSSHGGLKMGQHHSAFLYKADFVDTPSTTSTLTYKIQWAITNYTSADGHINRANQESTTYSGTGGSALTIIEIL